MLMSVRWKGRNFPKYPGWRGKVWSHCPLWYRDKKGLYVKVKNQTAEKELDRTFIVISCKKPYTRSKRQEIQSARAWRRWWCRYQEFSYAGNQGAIWNRSKWCRMDGLPVHHKTQHIALENWNSPWETSNLEARDKPAGAGALSSDWCNLWGGHN